MILDGRFKYQRWECYIRNKIVILVVRLRNERFVCDICGKVLILETKLLYQMQQSNLRGETVY